ncbi:MAG: flagellar hook-basal body complex protein FliE [Nitrospirae bacterium]|nr:flagellar hook-basal body complex protein FliE [Nitrospirota bacterium]
MIDEIKLRSVLGTLTSPLQEPEAPAKADGKGFGDFLKDAISSVNEVSLDAKDSVEKLVTGENHNLHETMIALQKADISFKLMMQIRNRLLEAYREITRMQG